MAAPGEKSFCLLEYHTSKSVVLCNVHFVQSTQSNIATWPSWPKGTDHCNSEAYRCSHVDARETNLNIVSMSAVSPVVHTSNISSCQKETFWQLDMFDVSNSIKAFGFLVINVCNHGEHYETPCIVYSCMQLNKNTKKHCCVSVATMVMRTRLNVMALEHSLSTWCVVDRAS